MVSTIVTSITDQRFMRWVGVRIPSTIAATAGIATVGAVVVVP